MHCYSRSDAITDCVSYAITNSSTNAIADAIADAVTNSVAHTVAHHNRVTHRRRAYRCLATRAASRLASISRCRSAASSLAFSACQGAGG